MEEMVETHPSEGDTLALTGTVSSRRTVVGTGLPCGSKLANKDEAFDTYKVTVKNVRQIRVGVRDKLDKEILTLETEDGDTVTATYRGKQKVIDSSDQPLYVSNSQGSQAGYNWKKSE
jgi:hypothetical protein